MTGHFSRYGWRALIAAAVLLLAAPNGRAADNILLIIADDMGVDVSSFYPQASRTATTPPAPNAPNLAKLAAKGVLFDNAWSQPTCSPTRASIFTGRYNFRTNIGTPVPAERRDHPVLSLDEFSLPEAFRAAKSPYMLSNIGKWHLSRGEKDPNLHGWPYFAGPHPDLAAITDYYNWPKTVNGVTRMRRVYNTTDEVNHTIRRIEVAGRKNRPYFVWLAFSTPHSPYHKPPSNLHTRDSLVPGSTDRAMRRPYYEAMVESLDTEIGRLLASVDLDTTTVIFIGDNGTPSEVLAPPLNGRRPHHGKNSVYEGGVRVPMLVAGAGVAAPGRVVGKLVATVDLYPTILDLAGIDAADVVPNGTTIDGVSFKRYIENRMNPSVRTWIYADKFEMNPNDDWERAVRSYRYKLIRRQDGSHEFYDLFADPNERSNLLAGRLDAKEKQGLDFLEGRMAALLATR